MYWITFGSAVQILGDCNVRVTLLGDWRNVRSKERTPRKPLYHMVYPYFFIHSPWASPGFDFITAGKTPNNQLSDGGPETRFELAQFAHHRDLVLTLEVLVGQGVRNP